MNEDQRIRSVFERLVEDAGPAANQERLAGIKSSKSLPRPVLALALVAVLPIAFAIVGWINAPPLLTPVPETVGASAATLPSTTTSTTQTPTGDVPTTDVLPYTPERGFVDVQLEAPGVQVKGLHVGESTEGFPVAAYVQGG